MFEQCYIHFFNKSPIANSIHRVIFNEEGSPIDYEFLSVNQEYMKLMGDQFQEKEIKGRRFYEVFPDGWDGEEAWKGTLERAVLARESTVFHIFLQNSQKWIRVVFFPLTNETFGCIYFDVTKEFKQGEQIAAFLKINIDILCVADLEWNFIRVNKAFEKVLGYTAQELEGKNFLGLIHEDDIQKSMEAMERLGRQEIITKFVNRVKGKDGTYRYLEWHSQAYEKYIYAAARDITETKKLHERLYEQNIELKKLTAELKRKNEILETLAIRDELTGLYNRHYLDRWIENDLEKGKYGNMPISMAVLDLDHFKVVNDRYGHMIGDKVLQQLSGLLKATTREKDILVRIGGEEIVLIMPGINKKDALKIAEELRCLIWNYQFPIEGHLSASFGIAERKPSESFEKWLERADQALYEAKQRGKNQVYAVD